MRPSVQACLLLFAVACSGATETKAAAAAPVGSYVMIAYDNIPVPARVYSDTSGDGIWITSGSLTLLASGNFTLLQRESTYTSISRAAAIDTSRAAGSWTVSGTFLTFTDTSTGAITSATIQNDVITDTYGTRYKR